MDAKEKSNILKQIKKDLPNYMCNIKSIKNVGTFFYVEVPGSSCVLADVALAMQHKYDIKISLLAYQKQYPVINQSYGFATFVGSKETTAALKDFFPISSEYYDGTGYMVWCCQASEDFKLEKLPALEDIVEVITNCF